MTKPVFAVVGLLPAHARHLERKVKDADVVFSEAKGDIARIPRADHCIILVGNVRHLHTDAAFRQFPRANIHYVKGGASNVLRTINQILKGPKP